MKNFTYKVQYILVIFFYRLLLLFPENLRFKFGDFLGVVAYKVIKKRRITAITNIKMAFPLKSQKEVEDIALKSFKIMIKSFLNTLWYDKYLKEDGKVITKNFEIFQEEYSKNKGVIVALIHMGNMEATAKVAMDYDVVTVAKKQRNPYIDDFITRSRKKDLNLTVYPKTKETSKLLIKDIKKKKIIALFSDHRDKGAIVNFFNMEAKSPTGAVSLALKFDVPLVLAYNYYNDDNTCTNVVERFELVKTDNFKNDVHTNTQKLISTMEEIIKKYPEQWMWFHDRWNLYSRFHKKRK